MPIDIARLPSEDLLDNVLKRSIIDVPEDATVERVCFLARIRPDRLGEYRRRHEDVWPDMRAALEQAGWRNYSLFLTDDGLLVGYLETDDFQAAQRRMAATDVNQRWQEEMVPYFADLGGRRPDEGLRPLAEIFHLDLAGYLSTSSRTPQHMEMTWNA
jgi:L-rhamnose mutarotase